MEQLERIQRLVELLLEEKGTDPMEIFRHVAEGGVVRLHGPEHHVLDGGAVLVAFHNAGGNLRLKEAMETMASRGFSVPGAVCGHWGVCGSVISVGSALSIIDGTGPLCRNEEWGEHMRFCSRTLGKLAETGGPRCCKRGAMIAMGEAVAYINSHYPVKLGISLGECPWHTLNAECIGFRCPFHPF